MELRKLDAEAISKYGLDQAWLSMLLEGKAIPADIQPLRALANALRVAPSDFVSAGVRHALLAEGAG